MREPSFDVIIVGAGTAGLMAAWELVQTDKSVAVIEAKNYIGGRIQTLRDPHFDLPVEMGAEFVHGNLELTKLILNKAGADHYNVSGDMWQNKDGILDEQKDFIEDYAALNKKLREPEQDISVQEFINKYLREEKFEEACFTLQNYVEGYYAARTDKASTFALREELNSSDEKQYRVEGGYIKLVDYLVDQCNKKGVLFFLSSPVTEITWQPGMVTALSGDQSFSAKKLLITVSIGVLQSEAIAFSPAIPQTTEAAKKLGFGPVIKTILEFDDPFWKNKEFTQGKNLDKLSFIFSDAVIPTWWSYYPKKSAMLTGWSGGPNAEKIKDLTNEQILDTALQSLTDIFEITMPLIRKKLKAWHVANWVKDAYTCGGYSYEVVDGSRFKRLLTEPIENTIFFAGEGLFEGPEIGTVEAALQTGRETAHRMIAGF